jgi:hypothetical protein
MRAGARIAAFVGALVIVFAGAALAGGAIEPRGDQPGGDDGPRADHGPAGRDAHADPDEDAPAGDHGAAPAAGEGHPVRGLAVAEDGLRMVVDDPELRRGRDETLRFRIVGEDGLTVRDFDVTHERRMHLIVARRDLTGFRHLHPVMDADGHWSTPLRLDEAGSYRVFADFSHEDSAITLAADLRVDGAADLRPLPEAEPTGVSDGGYDVRLDAGHARAGRESELRFAVTKDGAAVHTEPYLGAGGHLVALREGDLAFLHVHPTEHGDGDASAHDDTIGFAATFPTEGRYRLFLQFKHEGRVHTVAFTQEVSR